MNRLIFALIAAIAGTTMFVSDAAVAQSGGTGTLPAGTPVRLVMMEEIHSNRNQVGDEVLFSILEDVVVEGTTYLVAGTPVIGAISEVRPARSWGRGGYVDAQISSIMPLYSDPIRLTGSQTESGGSDTATSVGATVIIGISVVGILAGGALSGDTAVIDAGTEFTVFTAEDGEVRVFSDNHKRTMVNDWLASKVVDSFTGYHWDNTFTIGEAIEYIGYDLNDVQVHVAQQENYYWLVTAELDDGRNAEFTFQPFQEPYIGKWNTLEPQNFFAREIMLAMDESDSGDEDDNDFPFGL